MLYYIYSGTATDAQKMFEVKGDQFSTLVSEANSRHTSAALNQRLNARPLFQATLYYVRRNEKPLEIEAHILILPCANAQLSKVISVCFTY